MLQHQKTKPTQLSPYKTAKFNQHSRSRSKSPNRSANRSPNRSFVSNRSQSQISSTINSQYLWNSLQEVELFPPVCAEMLRNQERNILEFKKAIGREKNRITTEMEAVSVQINHIIEDYRLSMHAVMDRIYQQYISKYVQFKTELMQIIRLKDQIQGLYTVKQQKNQHPSKPNQSNLHALKSMQISSAQVKRYQILNYIGQLQKQKILPVSQKAQYLLILSQYDNGYFQFEEFKNLMNGIKAGFRGDFQRLYTQSYEYVRDPDGIVFREQERTRQSNNILNAERQYPTLNQQLNTRTQPMIQIQPQQQPQPIRQILIPQTSIRSVNPQVLPVWQPIQQRYPNTVRPSVQGVQGVVSQPPMPVPQSQYFFGNDSEVQQFQVQHNSYQVNRQKSVSNPYSSPSIQLGDNRRKKANTSQIPQLNFHTQHYYYHPQVIVSPQKISTQLIKISQQNPFSFKSKALDVILCALYIDDNLIAVGSKDGSLFFYDRNGGVVKAHQNIHKSSICTLELVNDGQYLATGSDHPCPEIILWNLGSYDFQPFCRLSQHKGAVTAIQCLQDNQHMVSGSYDKKLCVYSIHQQKLKYTLPSNKSSVTALTLNCNGSKLISCCLQNNAINIWQVVRNNANDDKGKVQTIFLQQVIQSNTMLCSVVSSAINPNIIFLGTKDGRLKIVDTQKNESIKNMSCCNSALIQMLVIEQPQGLPMVLCWPCKQKCFKIVDCETGRVVNVNTRSQLDFGCGVGPKVSGMKDGAGFVVCSQAEDRELYWYKVNRVI